MLKLEPMARPRLLYSSKERARKSEMEQLASAMATVVFTAVLLVTALFHVDRLHAPSRNDLIVRTAASR
jgi:hypothetical protein